ncbi:MAG: VanZ family protein [Actinobacteria bacterium]|nr:VanZ family protein [Actinomycetota bacterium]
MRSSPGFRWLPAVTVYAVILGLSSVPGSSLEDTPAWLSVVGHAAGYAALGAAIHHAWQGRGGALAAVALAVVLGVVNELQQGLVPGRSPDVADVAVDALGALAGVLVRLVARQRRGITRGRPGSRPPGPGSAARR